MGDKQPKAHAHHMPDTIQSQLDLSRSCCDLGLKCCKELADFNTEATQRTIAIMEAGRELLLENGFQKYMAETSQISISLWTAWWSTGIEFQRNLVGNLSKR